MCEENYPRKSKAWRRVGIMVRALVSGSSGVGSCPGRGHCVVFLEETLYSHSASPKSGVKMGSDAGGSPVMVLQAFSGEHYNILALNVFRNNYFEHSFSLFFLTF